MKRLSILARASRPRRRAFAAAAALLLASIGASAHVTLAPGGATAGGVYEAAFRVGHACKDTQATTGITVRIPEGFSIENIVPRPGWTLSVAGDQVAWRAATPEAALPAHERAEFVLRGRTTRGAGVLWFPVLQTCDRGSADWAQVPTEAVPKPDFPAARLDVLPVGVAPVQVRGAWAEPSIAGQDTAGVFMTLSAPSGLRLLGASTPAAGRAELVAPAATGDTHSLDLPPRELVELKPGGAGILLTQLAQALTAGTTLPVTLQFMDATGSESALTVAVPVLDPGSKAAAPQAAH
jgi:uncharacterized protein YcnI